MTPERWQIIVELAEAASSWQGEQRAAFLDKACDTDQSLRKEVESLLDSDEKAERFIEEPVTGFAASLLANTHYKSMIGQTIGSYVILDLLGAGGMGEVYLANDTRLGRKVALKILPSSATNNENRVYRFEREARAASALNHPNILTIHEISAVDSVHFIATEFVDGETLRERMTGGRLGVSEALEIAIQVASALEAAHEAGIVHRDIKPENIMIRPDGYVKVLDFGLAKLNEQQKTADYGLRPELLSASEPGLIMGTPRYMSPEQIRGINVDGRSDIFSLGIVIYEMVTGKAPFQGETVGDVIAAVLQTEPLPFARPMPAELKRILSRALSKEREQRYENAGILLADLRRLQRQLDQSPEVAPVGISEPRGLWRRGRNIVGVASGALLRPGSPFALRAESSSDNPVKRSRERAEQVERPAAFSQIISGGLMLTRRINRHKRWLAVALVSVLTSAFLVYYINSSKVGNQDGIRRIAVLPFTLESDSPDSDYLSDGFTESIINRLSGLPNLEVIAWNSVSRYKGKELNLQTVGQELNAQAILTGTMVRHGDNLLISINMVDVRNGNNIWGERFQERSRDILKAQENIARETSQRLRLKLNLKEQQLIAKQHTDNVDAYELYLRGRANWKKSTEAGIKKSIEYYNQAIELDPNYALAYAGLAASYSTLGGNYLPPTEVIPLSKAYAEKALEIDSMLAEAHYALAGSAYSYDWNFGTAEREFKFTLELNPNDADARMSYGALLRSTGRMNEAIAEIQRALDLDPLSLRIRVYLGLTYYFARLYEQAMEQFKIAIQRDPNFFITHVNIGRVYLRTGKLNDAIVILTKAKEISNNHPLALAPLGQAYALSGKKREAQQVLERLKQLSKDQYIRPYEMALLYAALGETEQALACLEKSYTERSSWTLNIRFEPGFDNLRSTQGFQDLLKRTGFQN